MKRDVAIEWNLNNATITIPEFEYEEKGDVSISIEKVVTTYGNRRAAGYSTTDAVSGTIYTPSPPSAAHVLDENHVPRCFDIVATGGDVEIEVKQALSTGPSTGKLEFVAADAEKTIYQDD